MSEWVSFAEVKQRVSLADVLARYGLLGTFKQRGDGLVGLCPFHRERTPSCHISLAKNAFQCFGCKRRGNVLDFVALMEHVGVRQAALLISEWFKPGEAPRPPSHHLAGAPGPKVQVNRPLPFALTGLDAAHPYLADRGLLPATVHQFGLGYCSRGLLAGRVAIPIHDEQGHLVAYAGRWPGEPPEGEAKYKLPAHFHKSRVIFNLHRAGKLVKEKGMILVEGFFDCFKVHQAGFPNACALMGSDLGERQRELLVEVLGQAGRIVLWFDEDDAGQRCLEACLRHLSTRLLVEVVRLPTEGAQPDQLGEAAIRQILGRAEWVKPTKKGGASPGNIIY